MKYIKYLAVGAVTSAMLSVSGAGMAADSTKEQYMPVLTYRTGPYATNGEPLAAGIVDYLKIVNERGGVNGVKLLIEECENGYDTARIIECYERLKNRHGGAIVFQPWSTGGTYAIAEKSDDDKIPVIIQGAGRSESADGSVFKWVFPILGNYWVETDIAFQAIADREGGFDKLKDKKIAVVYHDSPYGKEALTLLHKHADTHGFQLQELPVTPPGAEQKSTWLQLRRANPDYIILRSFGIMTPTSLKQARSIGYPMENIYGAWPASAEPDVRDLGEQAKGYNGIALPSGPAFDSDITREVTEKLYDQGKGSGDVENVGSVFWTRGAISSMMVVEAMRAAQEEFGKGELINGEQMQWGLEHVNLDADAIQELGFGNVLKAPIMTSCKDHMGAHVARIQTWNGESWETTSDWYTANMDIIQPMIEEASAKYAAEQGITPRECNE